MKQSRKIKKSEDRVEPGCLHPHLTKYIGYCFHKAALRVRAKVDAHLAAHKIVAPQFGMLALLEIEGPMTQNELGAYMKMDKATMVRMIDGLEANKWVTRETSSSDRRAKKVQLTAAGKKAILKLDELRRAAEREFLAPLTEQEKSQLRAIVNKLASAL